MQDFFDYLEYSISRALAKSTDVHKRHYWCDGIMPPERRDDYALQRSGSIAKRNQQTWIAARAWMDNGKTGEEARQLIYEMNGIMGKQALAAYRTGEDLRSCVPSEVNANWISIDIRSNVVTVVLL